MTDHTVYEDAQVRIVELLGSGDAERVEVMLRLYSQLFPDYSHYTARMRRRASLPPGARSGHIAHYWLVEVDEKPAGLCTFRYIQKRNCGIGVAFGLAPAVRSTFVNGKRLSKFVISMIMKQLARDSELLGSPEYWGLVTEVEHRELMEHYKRMGMHELPIMYIEPIFPSENGSVPKKPAAYAPVILGITPNPRVNMQEYDCDTLTDFALAFLTDHYGLSEDHETVRTVLNSIPQC